MPDLSALQKNNIDMRRGLNKEEYISVIYHDLFDYPLNLADLIKWKCGKYDNFKQCQISVKKGFYFVEGREGLIYKKLLKERISEKKIYIAKRVAKLLSHIPFIKMVGITGSVAMRNSNENGDIDFLIITKQGKLWTTRALVLMMFKLFGVKTRKFNDVNQKDKICTNIWLDERELAWKRTDRNIYTAHEIAQIIPLINKNNTYEKFLWRNKWVQSYWPNAVKVIKIKENKSKKQSINLLEKLLYKAQYLHMKKKITKETVTPTRALFHPHNWSQVVLKQLSV